ncbi:MAG: GtrA family protein [Clostridiales bacterium]|nr:GtrA family protein [Clostridiales bacterium]
MKLTKKEVWRAVKFTLFSISAGVIQFVSSILLELVILPRVLPDPTKKIFFIIEQDLSTFIADTVGLALSILWNFTFNRKFTFKAASNVPIAMLLAFVFYIPFYPFQRWYIPTIKVALASIGGWGYIIALGTCMIINFVLEFLWQQFVVFRGKVDTNELAKKQQEKEAAATEVSVENSVQVTVNITNNGADTGTNEQNDENTKRIPK